MRKIWEWVKTNPIRSMFLVPILLVAGISISHVVSWYNIANPLSWAIYLSIAIEVGAMTALIAATNRIKGSVWFMFGLVTLIQMIGNIFFSYKEIDPAGNLFKSWVELTGPIWEMIGSDPTDIPAMKRWLSFLEGGLLPIISLTSLHFFVKYDDGKKDKTKELLEDIVQELQTPEIIEENKDIVINDLLEEQNETTPQVPTNHPTSNDQVTTKNRLSNDEVIDEKNIEQLTDLQKESKKVWDNVRRLREEGKLPPPPSEEELLEEPTAIAFTPYDTEEILEETEEPKNKRLVYRKYD